MHDFESKKRQILDRVDLHEIVAEQVKLKRSGRRLVGLCPFHSEKTPSFTVSPEQGFFKCFGCGKGGDLFSFVQYRENVPFIEAMRILADRAGVDMDRFDPSGSGDSGPSRHDIAGVNQWAAKFFRSKLLDESTGRQARDYICGRGFSDDSNERFDLGLATESGSSLRQVALQAGFSETLLLAADLLRSSDGGRTYETFRNRLMFPIRDATNRVIGFGGRTLGDDRAKYLNTRQTALFDKGRNLYGLDVARAAICERGRVVVVEGYTDCLACHQVGVTEAVATLGTALTEAQIALLRRYCDEVILLFDADQAGEAAADRAINLSLPSGVRVRLAQIPDGKDPCDYALKAGASGFPDVLNRAVDALEFRWLWTQKKFNADTSDVKRKEAVLDFVSLVSQSFSARAVDAIQRGLIVNQIAHLVGMRREQVSELLRAARPRKQSTEGGGVRPQSVPRDEEQAAWTHVLEVVLNEPGLLLALDAPLDVSRIASDGDRRIATAVVELSKQLGEFRLSDVLARCGESGGAERIAELAQRGADRGNYEATFRLALSRLQQCAQRDEANRARDRLLSGQVAQALPDGNGQVGDELVLGMKAHRHFAPRRLIRQAVATTESASSTQEKASANATTMESA